jgi:beta-glucanase (GH16 family)
VILFRISYHRGTAQINGPWIGTGGNYIDPALAQVVQTFDGESNGYLELSVAAASPGQTPYHGSEVQSVNTYGYGTYETRMEVTSVPGVVASFFWDEHPSPSQYGPHEWDIEFLTNESWINSPNSGIVHLTIHPSNATVALPLSFNPSKGFHDYGFIWSPGKIVFTVDGAAAYTFTSTDLTTTATGLIMANTWTGNPNWGGGPPTQQATTSYDWMQFTPEGTSPPPSDVLTPQATTINATAGQLFSGTVVFHRQQYIGFGERGNGDY